MKHVIIKSNYSNDSALLCIIVYGVVPDPGSHKIIQFPFMKQWGLFLTNNTILIHPRKNNEFSPCTFQKIKLA